MNPMNCAWVLLKQDAPLGPGQPQQSQQQQPQQPPEQEESKPLYDQKQNIATAHYLLDDVLMIAQQLEDMYDGGREPGNPYARQDPDWARLLYDIQRIKQILEDALTGEGPAPQGGGLVG